MRILIAANSGFCDGVKRAIRLARDGATARGELQSDGPLVHNHQAIRFLQVHRIVAAADLADPAGKSILIRAHGIAPEQRRRWTEAGAELIDATCPRVARNQRLAADAARRGLTVVLAGDPNHPEMLATAGSAGPDCRILSTPEEAEAIALDKPFLFMAQTTFDAALFSRMADALRRRFPDCEIHDTICPDTHARQEEARVLAGRADVLVVVGGKHSSNTRRLAAAGRAAGKPVFAVETADELRADDFAGFATAAVISGASTPGWITQDVVDRLRRMGRRTPAARAQAALHFLAESRILTALSAGGLALAAAMLTGGPDLPQAAAGAGLVFFAHTINRRIPVDPEARRLSPADSFYRLRRTPLLAAAWLAAGVSLAVALAKGPGVAALFVASALAALACALAQKRNASAIIRTVDLPGFRNWIMAAGWAAILAGPFLIARGLSAAGVVAALYIFLLCFGGTLIRDLHDTASDRLMGIDTLPTAVGPAASRTLAAGAFLAAAAGCLALHSFSLAVIPVLGLLLLRRVTHRLIRDAVRLQAAVDGLGCLAGLAALAAWWLP